MAVHWTYETFQPQDDLRQGDILQPTAELQELLQKWHKHFLDAKYLAFMVVTQTCDLVRRREQCPSRYINLAVIRALDEVLPRLLDSTCRCVAPSCYSEDQKSKARNLLERIFNQNEQAFGLFYLYPDAQAGIGDDAVALLRVSVAFRSEHYDVFRSARRGRLHDSFSHKLGWLAGNLYSRVGTEDWSFDQFRKEKLIQKIKEHLDGGDESMRPLWLKKSVLAGLRNAGIVLSDLPRDTLLMEIEQLSLRSPKDYALDRMLEITQGVVPDLSEAQVKKLRVHLGNDQALTALIKEG